MKSGKKRLRKTCATREYEAQLGYVIELAEQVTMLLKFAVSDQVQRPPLNDMHIGELNQMASRLQQMQSTLATAHAPNFPFTPNDSSAPEPASDESPFDFALDDRFTITKQTPRTNAGGVWVVGTLHGHRFDALVFAEHADNRDWEIGDSRISKLCLQRQEDNTTVFNWDRGLDLTAQTDLAQGIVDFLAARLANHVFAK